MEDLLLPPPAPMAEAASEAERTPRAPKRSLRRFDTSPFTLQQHCAAQSTAVRDCIKAHNLDNVDPATLEERGWDVAPACKPLWESYRQCGINFFSATDWAQSRCGAEANAFRRCDPNAQGAEKCARIEQQEMSCMALC